MNEKSLSAKELLSLTSPSQENSNSQLQTFSGSISSSQIIDTNDTSQIETHNRHQRGNATLEKRLSAYLSKEFKELPDNEYLSTTTSSNNNDTCSP